MPKTTADELLDFLLIFPPLLFQYYLGVVLICFVHTCIIPICLDHKCSITKQAFLSYFTAMALRIEYSTKIGFKLRPHRRGSEHLYPLDRGAPPPPCAQRLASLYVCSCYRNTDFMPEEKTTPLVSYSLVITS